MGPDDRQHEPGAAEAAPDEAGAPQRSGEPPANDTEERYGQDESPA